MEQITVTIAEAQRVLGVGRTSIYRLVNIGRLSRRRVLGRTLITTESIRALIDAPETKGSQS